MNKRYMSKKDFGEDRTNVGYALYVRENLKPKDYFKTNTGEIYKSMNVSPISNGKIYYANGEYCWVNESAVINFSPNIIDLIEENDLVRIEYYAERYEERITRLFEVEYKNGYTISFKNSHCNLDIYDGIWANGDKELNPIIKSIVTKEQFESMQYKVD